MTGKMLAEQSRLLDQRSKDPATLATTTKTVVIAGTVVALALLLAVSLWLTRSITRPINERTHRIEEIADGDGDLSRRVDESRRDEVGGLARRFNRFADNVAGLVREIAQSAASSTSAAQELSAISNRMSANAERIHMEAAAAAVEVSQNVQTVASGRNR